jgi:hypothetical protein
VADLRARFPDKDIEVDGGVGPATIDVCANAGRFCIHTPTFSTFHSRKQEVTSLLPVLLSLTLPNLRRSSRFSRKALTPLWPMPPPDRLRTCLQFPCPISLADEASQYIMSGADAGEVNINTRLESNIYFSMCQRISIAKITLLYCHGLRAS